MVCFSSSNQRRIRIIMRGAIQGRLSHDYPRHVVGYHQVAVACSVYVHKFRSDTDSREQIPPRGARDQTLAHNAVIRESDPAGRKLHGGSGPILRCGQVGHR